MHARSHHAGPKGLVKTSDECMESVQESDPRGRRKQRERQQAAQEWRQGINESERQLSSLLRRFAWKVDRRAAKVSLQEIRERAGALTDFWLAPNPSSSEGGDGSRSGERERARAGSAIHARGGGVRGGTRSRGRGGAQASADDIHGARSGEAGNGDRMLWSVQDERGTLSGRNPSSAAQGEGDDGVHCARGAQERGRARQRRAKGSSNRTDAESERSRDGVGAGPRTELEKQLRDLQSAQQK